MLQKIITNRGHNAWNQVQTVCLSLLLTKAPSVHFLYRQCWNKTCFTVSLYKKWTDGAFVNNNDKITYEICICTKFHANPRAFFLL